MQFRKKGEITAFLTLLMIPICGLIIVTIKSAVIHTAKLRAELITETALDSAYSEYNVDLFEKYGLIFVDTTYHGGLAGDNAFSVHVGNYIEENTRYSNLDDIFELNLDKVEVFNSEYATDDNYGVLHEEISQYVSILGYYGTKEEMLDYYLEHVMQENLADYAGYSTKAKLEAIASIIENDLQSSTNVRFSMDKCLSNAEIKASYRCNYGVTFEIKKKTNN